MYYPNKNGKLDALMKKCQLTDADGCWFRNTISLQKLRSINTYKDEIIEALEEESTHLLNYIDGFSKALSKSTKNMSFENTPMKLQLGGWFYDLLYKPKVLIIISGDLVVEPHPFSHDYSINYEALEGEDSSYETENAQVTFSNYRN